MLHAIIAFHKFNIAQPYCILLHIPTPPPSLLHCIVLHNSTPPPQLLHCVLHCCRSSLNELCDDLHVNKIVLLRRLGECVCLYVEWCVYVCWFIISKCRQCSILKLGSSISRHIITLYQLYTVVYNTLRIYCNVLTIALLGVQLVLREYDFTTQPSFTEEDIFNILPIIRMAQFKVSTVKQGNALKQ